MAHVTTKSANKRLDYDEVADAYDQRYAAGGPQGIANALLSLARDAGAERILEVGCGTGYWLTALQPVGCMLYGLDLSLGMLRKARGRKNACHLVRGHAGKWPFLDHAFDLVVCVNAIHHFDSPRTFVYEARRILGKGGRLAVIGMNPHAGADRWCIYDYFPGTYEADLRRYPSPDTVTDWMSTAGFDTVECRVAERIVETRVGREILHHPILQKSGTSQLALLSDEEYAAGMARIEAALQKAEATGEALAFSADISFLMVTGRG